ncbi:TetR/AcrR family transcriptional regulator [Actibacterium ureilyticum]|uniref:TetR/AcrR family transcriptional regulator n=1 Tax=Actibacterium ureilyticum TaxID=1590614 RepID=UPI000BAB1478|nr:TetR/AcrR family transcriptional regulator [Actibacterium ureilyticum]
MPAEISRRSIGARRNPETEKAILDAAESILHEVGIAGLKMEAVARRAQAGKATLYRWWPTRGRLILAVYERSKADFALPDTGALQTDIALFYKLLFAFWSRPDGRLFRLIIAGAQSDPDMAEALEEYRQERRDGLRSMLARAADRGELSPGLDLEIAIDALMGLAWMRLLAGKLTADTDTLAATLCGPWLRAADGGTFALS